MQSVSQWKAERVRSSTTTIFAEMSALAVATGSVNLGQGFPDTDGPAVMLEAAGRRDRAPGVNQYPPGRGIARAAAGRSPPTQPRPTAWTYDPDTEVLVTTGATEALAARDPGVRRPGRRGDRARAVLRLLRCIDRSGRAARRVGVGLFGARLHARPRRARAPRSRRGPRRC